MTSTTVRVPAGLRTRNSPTTARRPRTPLSRPAARVGATGAVVDDAEEQLARRPAGGLDRPKTGTVRVTVAQLDLARPTTPTTRRLVLPRHTACA
jgi:hypothetical protein